VFAPTGNRGFSFFSHAEHGDVFFHAKDLEDNGFFPDDLVVDCSAVIDIEMKATGRRRTAKIHEINCRPGRLSNPETPKYKRSKPVQKKPTFAPGARAQGQIKVLKSGYGFLQESDHEDVFFALSCVAQSVVPCLEEGIDVEFEIESCQRGVMARITNIIWPKSRSIHRLIEVDAEHGLYIYRVTFPSGQKTVEVRDGPVVSDSQVVACPPTLTEARNWIKRDSSVCAV
jgi:cold shock CspA family protein